MTFKLKSHGSSFKMMGSSPARNMKTGNYNQSFESPVKQKSTKSSEGKDVLHWKDFNKNMAVSVEYNLQY